MRRLGPAAAGLLLLLLGGALPGCRSCPPAWLEGPPRDDGYLYGVGTSHEVFVEADALSLALTRAARVVADGLALPPELRLSVTRTGDTLFVEALGPEGPLHELDGLELVALARCGDRTHVLLRLARAP